MMRAASVHHVSRLALLFGVCGLFAASWLYAARRLHDRTVMREMQELPRIDLRFVRGYLDRLQGDYDVWHTQAERTVQDSNGDVEERTRAAVALARHGPEHLDFLLERMLAAEVSEHLFLRDELVRYREQLAPSLWRVAADPVERASRRLAAASALGPFDPAGKRWSEIAPAVVRELINLDPLLAKEWVQALQPARMQLRRPLLESFAERPDAEVKQLLAASILARVRRG